MSKYHPECMKLAHRVDALEQLDPVFSKLADEQYAFDNPCYSLHFHIQMTGCPPQPV